MWRPWRKNQRVNYRILPNDSRIIQNTSSNSTEYFYFQNVEQALDMLMGHCIIKLVCLVCYERWKQKYSNDQFMSVQQ